MPASVYAQKILSCLKTFDSETPPSLVPGELPLIDLFRKEHSAKGIFANVDAIFIQHHLGPLVAKVNAMVSEGLDKGRCWFIDIPYSTHFAIREKLLTEGFRRDQMTQDFADPLEDYDESQAFRVARLMHRVAERNNPRRLLVMDDGGYFIRYLKNVMIHSPELVPAFKGSCVVEQTTRGHRYLEKLQHVIEACKLSVVSIARCNTKLNFEAPFIGASVSRALIRTSGGDRLSGMKNIAVIGYGAVGKATVEQLAARTVDAAIDVVDVDDRAVREVSSLRSRHRSKIRGVKELTKDKQYELVLGCTGYNSFRLDQRTLLADGAVLASGSSAAIEFNRAGFVELADRRPDDEIEILGRAETLKAGIHAPIRFRQEGNKTFTFLNAGFPVNFDGCLESLPTRIIQATHCLLFAAAVQAVQQERPGFSQIAEKTDNYIFQKAANYL